MKAESKGCVFGRSTNRFFPFDFEEGCNREGADTRDASGGKRRNSGTIWVDLRTDESAIDSSTAQAGHLHISSHNPTGSSKAGSNIAGGAQPPEVSESSEKSPELFGPPGSCLLMASEFPSVRERRKMAERVMAESWPSVTEECNLQKPRGKGRLTLTTVYGK
ncbi:hypothetical protein U1Q18_007103 [Sarracenia purpurea var. burkii]